MRVKEKHDQEYMKRQNRTLVLNIIKNKRPISRADIAKITRMSPTSVGRIVGELIELGLIKETGQSSNAQDSNGPGRKSTQLDLDPNSVFTIGLYLDQDVMEIGVVDFEGRVTYQESIEYDSKLPQDVVALIVKTVGRVIAANRIEVSKIIGLGVVMPGIIDFKRGVVIFSAQLGWSNVAIVRLLQEKLNIRTAVDNEVKLRALAESLYGAARNSQTAIFLSLGSGVGSALIVGGEIYRGETNFAGEIGHTTVDPYGILCDCGRRGCLQTYIASGALIQEANKVRKVGSFKEIIAAAQDRENWAVSILERASVYAAIAINNAICMYSPDTVVLSGRLVEKYPVMAKLIEEKCEQYIWEHFKGTFQIKYSALGGNAEILGAATLVLNTYLKIEDHKNSDYEGERIG